MGVDEYYCGCLLGFGQAIDMVDFQPEDVSSSGVPRDGTTLADIPKEMMLGAECNLLDLQIE
jgi:hypothetical protein